MHKIKVLWMSNKLQSAHDKATGSWLKAMAEGLTNSGKVELGNLSRGNVEKITRQDFGEISQWIIPFKLGAESRFDPSRKGFVREIVKIVDDFSPDLIHIWGTEDTWGLLTARHFIQRPVILEMQGLKDAIAQVFHGGLTVSEQLACVGVKEIIKRSTIFQKRKGYEKWRLVDREIISGHRHIAVQTEWMEAQVKSINSDCEVYRSDRLLRGVFYKASPWQYSDTPVIFCSSAYPAPFKGLHVAIRATAILKQYYPNIQLRIAGALQWPGIRQDGYIAWLNREVKRLELESNVNWLGPLSAAEIVSEIQSAAAMVLPSYIENCSNLMQEGMMMSIPVVASYVGGLPSLAGDEKSALFFPPGDEIMCAHQIMRLLSDQSLAERISHQAREVALERNNCGKIIQKQMEIYRQVLRGNEL